MKKKLKILSFRKFKEKWNAIPILIAQNPSLVNKRNLYKFLKLIPLVKEIHHKSLMDHLLEWNLLTLSNSIRIFYNSTK